MKKFIKSLLPPILLDILRKIKSIYSEYYQNKEGEIKSSIKITVNRLELLSDCL